MLNEYWHLKKKLSSKVTNYKIDEIYKSAIEQGALGGKLLGSGGGGFFIFYVPKSKQKKFTKYFNKLIHIPFQFSSEGSKIIFKSRD